MFAYAQGRDHNGTHTGVSFPLSPEKKAPPLLNFRRLPSFRQGFSLIELLAVLGVMALVMAFAMPAVNPILKGSQLNQAAQDIGDQLGLARQLALSSNRSMEVRFYKYADPELPGEVEGNPSSGYFRGMQIFEIAENGVARARGKMRRLPSSIVIDGGSTLSTLLAPPGSYTSPLPEAAAAGSQTVSLPRAGVQYASVAFRFLPDGSLNLSSLATNPWFLTLRDSRDKNPGGSGSDGFSQPPPNFFTIQIDAANGHIKTYRP